MLHHQAFLLLLQPVAVVALVRHAVTPVEFQNPLGGVVQKVAIMGDGHHGAGIALQKLLEPVHRFSVQVVGGLIQQQHVGFGQQQTAQGHAAFFTTRQQADLGVPRGQPQGICGNLKLVLGVSPCTANNGFHLGLLLGERVKVGIFFAIGRVDFLQSGFGGEHVPHACLHAFTHGLIRIELGLLRQVADIQAGHRDGLALKFLIDTGHDFQQRRLAGAIRAQYTDLGAREKTK